MIAGPVPTASAVTAADFRIRRREIEIVFARAMVFPFLTHVEQDVHFPIHVQIVGLNLSRHDSRGTSGGCYTFFGLRGYPNFFPEQVL